MKLTLFFVFFSLFQVSASVYSQTLRLTIKLNNASVKEALNEIEEKSNVKFLYKDKSIESHQVSIDVEDVPLDEILNAILEKTGNSYHVLDNNLIIISPEAVLQHHVDLTGKVTDSSGNPLPGVTVVIKGTTKGTITDADGNYILPNVPGDGTLVFSFVGMRTQEITVAGKTQINVIMADESIGIEEVVAVGYGTMRKSDLTGSVTSVKVDETAAQQNTTVDQLLQGRAAGVHVIQNSGSPGSGVSVRIRGASSLRGNNEPLYVVDGIIISSAGEDAANANNSGESRNEVQNGLNGINPRDIESLEILKDASATAIYGSRGANGVVLITTKKGKSGSSTIRGYVNTSVSQISKKLDVLNGLEYAKYQNESFLESGRESLLPYSISDGNVYPITYDNDGVSTISSIASRQINWQDEIFKRGVSTDAGASFSGGTDKGNYYVSVGFKNTNGIAPNTGVKSGNFSINLSQKLSDKLMLNSKLSSFYGAGDYSQSGDIAAANNSFIFQTLKYRPLITDDDTGFNNDLETSNPYSFVNDFEDKSKETRFMGSFALTYQLPVKGLSYKLQAAGDIRIKERRRFFGLTTWQGRLRNGQLSISDLEAKAYQINNLLTYNRVFEKKHSINIVAGVTYDEKNTQNSVYEVQNFSTTVFTVDAPVYGQIISRPLDYIYSKAQLLSYLTRVGYNYGDKYSFTGTFRADGSSKFSATNRYSYFPSFAMAWRVNNENFLKGSRVVSQLKLRAGWGQTGNQGISSYQTLANYGSALYGNTSNGVSTAFIPLNIGNSDLKWETTTQLNFGLDFGFWNNRISGTIDVYNKQTDDLLQQEVLPASSGFGYLLINRGSLNNKGLEISLDGFLVKKDDFSIEIGGNIAFNKSEIQSLGIPLADIVIDGDVQQRSYYLGDNISSGTYFKCPANAFIEGEPIGLFYGFQTDGIYQTGDDIKVADTQAGDIRIIDQNGDGVIDSQDRTIIGNPNPDFVYGGFLNINYKKLSLSVQVNGVSGNDIANGNLIQLEVPEGVLSNILVAAYENAWRPDSPSDYYPRINYTKENNASAITDRIIENGSYFRLSNITLSYDLPVKKLNIFNTANLFISGSNLLMITGYSGYNPEVTSFMYNANIIGVDFQGFPNASALTMGLNLTF